MPVVSTRASSDIPPPEPPESTASESPLADLHPLGPDALAVRRIRDTSSVALAVLAVAAVAVVARLLWSVPVPSWTLGGLAGCGVILMAGAWVWSGIEHRRWGWRLDDDLFEVRHGVLVHHVALVPRSRIQNITTSSGPLQERRALVTLTVHTAGARTPGVSVQDIESHHADAVKAELGLV